MAVTAASGASVDPLALWVVPVAELGGVARHVTDVARVGLPGYRLAVLCPEGPLAARLRAQGAAVMTGPLGPEAGVRSSVRTLRRAAWTLKPAIVHTHLAYADIVSALTRLPGGTRRFTTEHGIAGDDAVYHGSRLQSRAMAVVHHLRLRRFDGAIAVSQATKRAMIKKWRPKLEIAVVPNGVDVRAGTVRREPRKPGDPLRVLSLSRLSPEKRIDKLIEAFALVLRETPDATLTIAGHGPMFDELSGLSRRLGVAPNVVFPGFLDPEKAMANADVVAQLSHWENCSYTILDAAAGGVQVVAAAVGGNPEILPPHALVDPENVDEVARALGALDDAVEVHVSTLDEQTARTANLYRLRFGLSQRGVNDDES